jgi:ABC-type phosphate/phosphonate transport system substrate-binding protein
MAQIKDATNIQVPLVISMSAEGAVRWLEAHGVMPADACKSTLVTHVRDYAVEILVTGSDLVDYDATVFVKR